MATASVKEALACGQYLCLCQFIREGGCIGKYFAYLNCAKIFVSVSIHQGRGLYWQVLCLSELCKEKKGGQQRRFRISNTGNLNQISMKGVYQKI